MPINLDQIRQVLQNAIREYREDQNRAVRGGRFISPIHTWCAQELMALGLPADHLVPHPEDGGYLRPTVGRAIEEVKKRVRTRLRGAEFSGLREQLTQDLNSIANQTRRSRLRVLGGYLEKEIDVCLIVEDTGPLLAISVKSQMSSISKNSINRFEEYVGDATNLHSRYPMLVLGFLLVVPANVETFNHVTGQPTDLLRRIKALLEQATGRGDPTGTPGSYEASALVVVDFHQDPPAIVDSFPPPGSPLRVESFFDQLVELYRRRNQPLAVRQEE